MKNYLLREVGFAPEHRDFWETRFWENYRICEKYPKYSKINGFDDLLFSDFPKNEKPKSVFGDSQTFLGMFLGELVLVKFYSGGALCEKKVIREDAKKEHC